MPESCTCDGEAFLCFDLPHFSKLSNRKCVKVPSGVLLSAHCLFWIAFVPSCLSTSRSPRKFVHAQKEPPIDVGDGGSCKIVQIRTSFPVGLLPFQLTALKHSPATAPIFTAVQTSLMTFSLMPWKALTVCTPPKCANGLVAGLGSTDVARKRAGREETAVSIF